MRFVHFYIQLGKWEFAMASRNTDPSWLDVVAGLLSKKSKLRPPRLTRRLVAERLEGRAVLSVAPVPVELPESEETLEYYLAQEQEMGPVVPAELAAANDSESQAVSADQVFSVEPSGSDTEFGEGEGEDPGGGGGSGSGSGSGSGGSPEEPEIVEPEIETEGGNVTVTGQIVDDGNPEELTITLEGGIGNVTLDSEGGFSIQITDSQGNGTFTITVTDGDGNTTTHTYEYPI